MPCLTVMPRKRVRKPMANTWRTRATVRGTSVAGVTDRLCLATGSTEVLASLRRSLAGQGVTAPLAGDGPERDQALAMLRPGLPVDEPDAAAIIATSGSTGRPRGVVLSRSALVAAADAAHRRLAGPGSWVLALPPHYIAGLMVVVRSLVAGRPPSAIDGRLTELPQLTLPGDGPHYLSLVPIQLSRALTDPAVTRSLTRFAAVLVGGSAADPELLQRAAELGVSVVPTYGMTETCGGCVFDGRPLDGVEVTVGEDDCLVVEGPVLFSGYRLDPAATHDALVDGRLRTRDRGAVIDGHVTVRGRVDDVVVTGGMNVDLATVERHVRTWARRVGAEAAVVGVPHPAWGTEVVAVTEPGSPPHTSRSDRGALTDLQRALGAELPGYAVPRRLVEWPSLPRTAGGKIDRRQVVSDLTSDAGAPQ